MFCNKLERKFDVLEEVTFSACIFAKVGLTIGKQDLTVELKSTKSWERYKRESFNTIHSPFREPRCPRKTNWQAILSCST